METTVRVMRSHDYCHFEVSLSRECEDLNSADALRKEAALLVDEAVRQYKIAREKERQRESADWQKTQFLKDIKRIEDKPESEWTVDEAAKMRSHADREFWKQYEDDEYYYDYDPDRDHHFSMLRKFQDTRISA